MKVIFLTWLTRVFITVTRIPREVAAFSIGYHVPPTKTRVEVLSEYGLHHRVGACTVEQLQFIQFDPFVLHNRPLTEIREQDYLIFSGVHSFQAKKENELH